MSKAWKQEFKTLCKDFQIPKAKTKEIINEAENANVPAFYNGNTNAFRYDYARRKADREIKNV